MALTRCSSPAACVALGLVSLVSLLGPGVAVAAEPVAVYLKSPIEVAEQRNLEAVLRDLPMQKSKWAAFGNSTMTYVVRQKSVGLLKPDPCEGLP
jgi:hypothetical protein